MAGHSNSIAFPQPRVALGAYAFIVLIGAFLVAERLTYAAAGVSADTPTTVAASGMASTVLDQVAVNVDVILAKTQLVLARAYFDWIAPIGDSLASLATVPDHMIANVMSLLPFGDAQPTIVLGRSPYLIF